MGVAAVAKPASNWFQTSMDSNDSEGKGQSQPLAVSPGRLMASSLVKTQ
jgi:hypothetical protein